MVGQSTAATRHTPHATRRRAHSDTRHATRDTRDGQVPSTSNSFYIFSRVLSNTIESNTDSHSLELRTLYSVPLRPV